MSESRPAPASLSPASSAPSPEAIDASCRWPVLGLYYGASVWLVVSAIAFLVASMSFHAPAMFADSAWLSYGRMAPVANQLLLYGFCIPAGWASALWILSRLGRTPLAQPALIVVGAKVWNLGILVGTVGILTGAGSGLEKLEFPVYAGWILWVGSLLIGMAGLLTLRQRSVETLHPSQWFAGLSVLWFPWVYVTALCLLQVWPVRGVAQGAVQWWCLAQLQLVLPGLFAIGVLFHFLPRLEGSPLASRHLAVFTLVSLIFCGGWIGVPLYAPVPAWITAISRIMSVCLVLPLLALMLNLWPLRRAGIAEKVDASRYLRFGVRALVGWTLLVVITQVTPLWRWAAFTLVEPALFQLLVHGFAAMVLLGGAYLILPQVAGTALPFPAFARFHFWFASTGLLLVILPFLAGGFRQGAQLAQPDMPFMDVAEAALMPIRVASLGQLLLIVGHLFLACNVVTLLARLAWARVRAFDQRPAGVTAVAEGRV